MKISIIVPAYNEEKLLARSLRGIQDAARAFEEQGWASELIVCDNNSTDRTAEVARAEGARVVFEPVNQIARARNTGAKAASGHWLIFIDADSVPSAELFGEVRKAIQDGRYLAGGSTVKLDVPDWPWTTFTGAWNLFSRLTRWCAGSFIFCERAAFWEVGGFDLAFFVGEEVTLSRRLKRLARTKAKKLVILHRFPLVTSGRKTRLYSKKEHLHFLWQLLRHPMATKRDRDACSNWYDGRR